MAKALTLPDGSLFPLREGEDPNVAFVEAQRLYPEAFGIAQAPAEGPKSGFMPALKAGVAGIKGAGAALAGRTGLMGLPEAEKYIAEQEAYKKKTFAPTAEGWTEAPLTKIGELAGGSLPYIAAPLIAGVAAPAAGALGLGAGAATAVGLGATGLASAAQFTGSNLQRQMEQGKKLEETDLGAAALASIPQAALDVVSLRMMPGLGKMFDQAGVKLTGQAAKDLANEALKKTAADYLMTTGKTMGVEGLTEASQQVFERMQAGLSITDPSARAEYWNNFIGGAVLGGILAPAGRYVERGKEQGRFETEEKARQGEERAAAAVEAKKEAALEEARKQTPEYAQDIVTQYTTAQDKVAGLKTQLRPIVKGSETAEEDKAHNRAVQSELKRVSAEEVAPLKSEFNRVKDMFPRGEELFPGAKPPTGPELDLEGKPVTAYPREAEAVTPEAPADEQQQVRMLKQLAEQYQTQASETADPQALIQLGQQHKAVEDALAEAQSKIQVKADLYAQIAATQKKIDDARQLGDVQAAAKNAQKLLDLQEQAGPIPMEPFKGKSESVAGFEKRVEIPQAKAELETRQQLLEAQQPAAAPVAVPGAPNVSTYLEDVDQLAAGVPPVAAVPEAAAVPEVPAYAPPKAPILEAAPVSVVNVGGGKQPEKTRKQLMEELQAARATRNTLAAENAINSLRAMDELSKVRSEAARGIAPLGEVSTPETAAYMAGEKLTPTPAAELEKRTIAATQAPLPKAIEAEAPATSQAEREKRDAEKRVAEQQRAERLATIPGESVSFEAHRRALETLDEVVPRVEKLEARIADVNETEPTKLKAKRELKKLSLAQKFLESSSEGVGELRLQTEEALAKVKAKIAVQAAAVAESPTPSRKKELGKSRLREKELTGLLKSYGARSVRAPIETTSVKARKQAENVANRFLEQSATLESEGTLGKLPPRIIGPVARPERIAGNVRTGTLETAEARTLPTRSKVTQIGQVKTITPKQAALEGNVVAAERSVKEAQAARDRAQFLRDNAKTAEEREDTQSALTIAENRLETRKDTLALAKEALVTPAEKKTRAAAAAAAAEKEETLPGKTRATAAIDEDVDTDFASEMRDDTNSTLLNDDAIFAVREGNTLKAVDAIAKNGSSELVQELAAKLKPFLEGVKISVNPNVKYKGESVAGLYKADTNAIEMHPMWLTEEDVLHEMAHAATMQILSKPSAQLTPAQREAVANLNAMFNALNENKSFTGEYALKDIKEFVAEVYSNQQLRNKLDAMGKPVSAWKRFKEFFARLIGFTPEQSQSKKLLADIDKIMSLAQVLNTDTLASPKRTTYANEGLAAAGEIGDQVIVKNKSFYDKVKAHSVGLAWETALVDRFAGFERLSRVMDSLKGTQMMYYLRMYDQRMNFVSQAVSKGALKLVEKTRADGAQEFIIESKEGPSLKGVVQILKDAPAGSPEAANRLFTLYLAAFRAENKGFASLHMGDLITPEDLKTAVKAIEATPGLKANFDKARNEYNEYNRGLVDFLAQTGAVSKALAAKLLKENDYIPFYRPRNGNVELIIGNESPIRIGNIAAQPYLQELVGSGKPILDFMTSSVQNTNMLTDMALRNIATKNAVFELVNLGLATIGKGSSAVGTNIVKFKVDGEDRFAMIDTDTVGIPADILVKGMEGIPTQMPFAFRILGAPAQLLRKAVTLSPLYAGRQLFRDSIAAPILAGADFVPVIGALKELRSATKDTLESRGITGGQVFTGGQEDLVKILRDISEGKDSKFTLTSLISKAEALNMAADATTRRAQYNSYIKQGLSEMEATLMSLESMNFNKRGASPSIHIVNSIIPFFNAQIQGLNVLYKAATGKMPFNERLKIQEKMLTRGLMIAGGTLAYAAMMSDDEAYKNATPEQKYGNWFVRIPGMDEPIKLPIPFEVGYIFKALPEALYNTMTTEHGGEEAVKAFKTIILQTIPGGSSYGIPQALKPAIEAGLGKSFYTGRDILSRREQTLLPEQQFRENTSEIAKSIGKVAGVSPIVLEQLVSGYTGTMGLAFLQAVSLGVPTGDTPEKAYKRLSDTPVVGGLFQTNDAGGIINSTYDRMNEFKKVKATFDDMLAKGDRAGAKAFIQERGNEYAGAQLADQFSTTMSQLTKYEQAVRASDATPEKKREQLDSIRKLKIRYATTVRQAADKAIPR